MGHASFELSDATRARRLLVTVWYPAAVGTAVPGEPVENLVPAGADRDSYRSLLDAAPPECPSRASHSAPDADLAGGAPFPLVLFSHCHNCLRFSSMSVAERLASHGFVVAAPDHTGNTLFDELSGTAVSLSKEFLQTRALDLRFLLDTLLDADVASVPDQLRGSLDSERVGVFGHSFGGVTTGLVLQDDARIKAGVSLAAPVENPLLPGVEIAGIHKPLMFLLAKEDNSILEIGNDLIRDNFEKGNPPLYNLEVVDAGHWSFSDICGLTSSLKPGCGEAQRQTDVSETFTYLPVEQGIAIASNLVASFFASELRGERSALDSALAGEPTSRVEVNIRQ